MTSMTDASGTTAGQALSARHALSSRLRVAARYIPGADADSPQDADPAADAAAVLEALVVALIARPAADSLWLVLTAISTCYPTRGEIDAARRMFELDEPIDIALRLLDEGLDRARRFGEPLADLEIVVGGVVVDVEHTARYNLHTGIQRVVRHLMPYWVEHGVLAVAWTSNGGMFRRLDPRETQRVFDWSTSGDAGEGPDHARARSDGDRHPALVVPWRSVVVLAEVPRATVSDRLAALGDRSGNRVVGIGYDAIPVVSADLVPPVESSKFVRYLTALKFSSRIAGISAAATAEIGGFVQMLVAQGLPGPVVTEVSLPAPPAVRGSGKPNGGPPLILVVGSHEPRKNHLAVLHAAEVLWREGLRFRLTFIGGSGWGDDFPRLAADRARSGRPVVVLKAVSDEVLDKAMDDAAFTVFPSLHEGYGLPVVESLAHGTPAITSNFGSTLEIARGGGAMTVDPRDDKALTDAIRVLLVDPTALAELRAQIGSRTTRGWDGYADALWGEIVTPELAELADQPARRQEGAR